MQILISLLALFLAATPAFAQVQEKAVTFKTFEIRYPSGIIIGEIDIKVLDAKVPKINAEVNIELPDSCTKIGRIEQRREGNILYVLIHTSRAADAICPAQIVRTKEIIPLQAEGLTPGDYTVEINGEQQDFTLE